MDTQHFERNRLELHPDAAAPWTVQLGRLGADRLAQLGGPPRGEPQTGIDCQTFPTTGQVVCEPFLTYWQRHGLDLGDRGTSERESLALLGLPLSAAQLATNPDGDTVVTQWFERARLEDHGAQGVLLGRLGVEVDTAARLAAAPAGWVTIQGDRLVAGEQPVQLKGVNYYPSAHPWAMMWMHWDGPAVDRELRRLQRDTGANTVRILVPYRRSDGWTDDRGTLLPGMLDRLLQFVQLAGQHQLKVIVTLFDWHAMLSKDPRVAEYEQQYLAAIVGVLRDDDRVLAWDVHNEPDNYPEWKEDPAQVVGWVTRQADAIHRLDQRHPVTVGVGRAPTLWQPGPDGRTILEVSDLVSVHSYDAAQYAAILTDLRARTAKPILLEEFGWPSGPECVLRYHDEASQLYLFGQAGAALTLPGVVGGLSWWLQDPPINEWFPVQDENAFFGLYRPDGSAKPALAVLRSWPVAPLPSVATSQRTLTVVPPPQFAPRDAPVYFGPYMLYGSFKYFWVFFGGAATFGAPITQPYRDSSGKLVQYFERARFELNESEHVQPIDPDWPEGQTDAVYLDRVHLAPLGTQLAAGRTFAPVADPHEPGVQWFAATGHTLRGDFAQLWATHGAAFFGPPISEELTETVDGAARTVQYFTHWRMERAADGTVRLGALGGAALAQRPCERGW